MAGSNFYYSYLSYSQLTEYIERIYSTAINNSKINYIGLQRTKMDTKPMNNVIKYKYNKYNK